MKLDPKLRTSCVEGVSCPCSTWRMSPPFSVRRPRVKDKDGRQKPRESGEDGGKEDENADRRSAAGCGGTFHPWTN